MLDNGHVREYDSPNHLLADRKSIFFSMAADAGLSIRSMQLHAVVIMNTVLL